MPDWLHFLGRLHPVVLHLPIGLLAAAILVDLLGLVRRGDGVRRVGTVLLTATLVAALVAVGTGLLLAEGDRATGDTVTVHRWLGIAATIGLAAALGLRLAADSWRWRAGYAVVLTATAGLVTMTGHLGGLMTHGPAFLAQHAPAWMPPRLLGNPFARDTDAVAVADPVAGGGSMDADYAGVVAPALETHCVRCHGAGDASAGVRLDSPLALAGAGDSGLPLVVPGDAMASLLVRRITLPHDDERFMPPDGGDRIDPETTLAIMAWIDQGARTVIAAPDPLDEPPPAAPEETLAVLAAGGAMVVPESQGSTRLVVAIAGAPVSAELAAALDAIADRVVDLDAARVTGVERLAPLLGRMTRLERASFAETTLGDAELTELAGLTRLDRLNLRGTPVTDASVPALASMPALRTVVLTETAVSDEARARLAARRPDLTVVGHEAVVPREIDPEPAFTSPTAAGAEAGAEGGEG